VFLERPKVCFTFEVADVIEYVVVALAIALEILRTHGHKLTNTRVPWSQQIGSYTNVEKGQWL